MRDGLRALAVPTLAAAVATALIAAPISPSATTAGPESTAWLADSTASIVLMSPVLVRGVMLNADGQPAPGRVSVVAWPPSEVLGGLRVGDAVETVMVARATVGSDGTFVLRVGPTVLPPRFMTPDRTVNFEIVGETGSGWAFFSFPRTLVSSPRAAWVDPLVQPAELASHEVLEVTLQPGLTDLPPPGSVLSPLPASDETCTSTVAATYDQLWGIVGEVYPGPHSKADFQFGLGSKAELGVGASATGAWRTFSAGGTAEVSHLGPIGYTRILYPMQAADSKTVFTSTFGYQKIRWLMYTPGVGCVDHGYRVRPGQWQGGAWSNAAATAPPADYCSPFMAGARITKETGTATTFADGVSIKGVIGIDLPARTAFNWKTSIRHIFTSAGQLCGSNADWPWAARIVGR
jgi:hypothetical protein